MRQGWLIYCDSPEDAERLRADLPVNDLIAVFSRSSVSPSFEIEVFRCRPTRDREADLAALQALRPGIHWSLVGSNVRSPLQSLTVVTCHFNPCGYARPVANLRRFLRQMERDGIDVYGTELVMPGRPAVMNNLPNWRSFVVGAEAILWQKEALLNATIARLPVEVDAVAAVDADLFFEDWYWEAKTLQALEDRAVVQPFQTGIWTSADGSVVRVLDAAAKLGLGVRPWRGHPGFAWAFRRDWFESVGGFYPYGILGSGDCLWAHAVVKQNGGSAFFDRQVAMIGEAQRREVREWTDRVRGAFGDKMAGWVPGAVVHEYHGSLQRRRHAQRGELLVDFDRKRDVVLNEKGWLEWSSEADRLLKVAVRQYFENRREDV